MGKASRRKKQKLDGSGGKRKNLSRGDRTREKRSVACGVIWLWIVGVVIVCIVGAGYLFMGSNRSVEVTNGWPESLTAGSLKDFNVLIVTLDTTRKDRLGCYGYVQAETPELDDIARRGLKFTRAVTVAPITLTSHATLFTGLYPPNHGARDNGEYELGADQTTLAEIFRDTGYETAAFVSAFVLNARFGTDQGFDLYDDTIGSGARLNVGETLDYRTGSDVTDMAVKWLRDRDRTRRFFTWVHYFDPHRPYKLKGDYAERFADRQYDGEIAQMDHAIGQLVTALEQEKYLENTLIIFISDHGESLGDHQEPTHANLVYDAVMNAPFILFCPGKFTLPHEIDDLTCITDIFPTVLRLNGIGSVGQFPCDGVDLTGGIGSGKSRTVYMETMTPYIKHGWSPLFAIRGWSDKYIKAPTNEYYDLNADPGELDNLVESQSPDLQNRISSLRDQLADKLSQWPSVQDVLGARVEVDAETWRELNALGYVQTLDDRRHEMDLANPREMMPVLHGIDLAGAYLRARDLDSALREIKRAEKISPNDRHVLKTMGKIYLYMGNETKAVMAFKRVIRIRPDVDVYLSLSQIMMKNSRLMEAGTYLEKAFEMDSQHGGLWIARGDLHRIHHRREDALNAYRKAIEVDEIRVREAAEQRIRDTLANRPLL